MASSKNGAVRKLNDKIKAQTLKRVFGPDNRRGSRVTLQGIEHHTKTEYLINDQGRWYGISVTYEPIQPKVVAFRKPEDRKPVGFVRQCRTRWDKR